MEHENKEKIASAINILGEFCGPRDIEALTTEALQAKYHIPQVDVAVLFGGSILAGGDVFAEIMQNRLAKTYIIVGGAGHTTETLRQNMLSSLQADFPPQATEAELFDQYLREKYGLKADYLECESTNCGNNITLLLALLKREGIPYKSLLLTQDASMQRRMDASWRRYVGEEQTLVNYAAYRVKVIVTNGELCFEEVPTGMWTMERYIELLMGDAARLQDNADGYGPKGKNFIAHVDMPSEAQEAFSYLKQYFAVRKANPAYGKPAVVE